MIDTKEKFYTCKYDRPFKEIMLKENNKDILKCLLENILKVKINEILIKPTERNTGNLKIKRKTLDALLLTNQGKIGIEVNANPEEFVHPRNMAYICDVYASHTLVGEEYDESIMIIQINLTYGIVKDKEPYRIYYIQDKEQKKFVNNFKIVEINMEYYKNIWYHKNEKEIEKNKYIVMLDLELEDLKKLSQKNKVVQEYMEELEKLNSDVEFREYMSAEEDARKIYNSRMKCATEKGWKTGIEQGLQQGLQQGIQQGIEKTQQEIVKNLNNMNMSINQISKVTGLLEENIKKIISQE